MKQLFSNFIFLIFLFTSITFSQVPRIINYQGLLLGQDEQPIPEGEYNLTLSLYDESGTQLWTETHQQVLIARGLFQVHLGAITPLELPFDQTYFLGIKVGNDPELEPRIMLTSSAYSLKSSNAERLDGFRINKTPLPNNILPLDSAGMFPASVIPGGGVNGDYLKRNLPDSSKGNFEKDILKIHNFGTGRGLTVISDSSHGIYGKSNSSMAGVEGEGAGLGPGVRGSSANDFGVIGFTNSHDKAGVYGNDGSNYTGVGVMGESSYGSGVYGTSNNIGTGVQGVSSSSSGVVGRSLGGGYGVEGRSETGDGVIGSTKNSEKSGVFGTSLVGIGVTGRSEDNDGILAVTTSNQTGHSGLRARNEGAGPAITCEGDLFVTGEFRGNRGAIGGAPFPKPAFDTGWITIEASQSQTFKLDIGGNPDDYFFDIQHKYPQGYYSNYSATSFFYSYWISSDTLVIHNDFLGSTELRVRVWRY